ncbi:hypothetical protein ACVOMV_13285 [Mesorhizobium atlanticum]
MKFDTVPMETPAVRATSAMVGRLRCKGMIRLKRFKTLAVDVKGLNEIIFQRGIGCPLWIED